MKHPQVINLLEDAVMVFDGDIIIDATDQLPLGTDHGKTTIQVDINFFDVTSGLPVIEVGNAELLYKAASDHWAILLNGEGTPSDIVGSLTDRHTYVALVSETSPGSQNMRSFKIADFSVDNNSFENVWMKYPYEVVITGSAAHIRWYLPNEIGGVAKFEAEAYEGGTGSTFATAANRVTHRGAITPL